MLTKIKSFLYALTHAAGRLFGLTADVGPFRAALWVGRTDSASVSFAADVTLNYHPGYPALAANVSVGVIEVELSLTRNPSE